MPTRFLAAAVQLAAGSAKAAHIDTACELVRAAAKRGAELVVLPEVFAWRGTPDGERAVAETIPGPTSERLAALARELRIVLVGGSLLEVAPGDAKPFNTCTVYGRD